MLHPFIYPRWDLVAMCIALAIVFAIEMLGVFSAGREYVTITSICRTFIPLWLRAPILGWMVYHFMRPGN